MIKYILTSAVSLSIALGITAVNVPSVWAEEDEDNEVEFTSASITALACAKEAEETGDIEGLISCPPHKAWEGVKDIYTGEPKIVVFDVTEEAYYFVQASKDSVYYYELLEGYDGSMDASGVIVGEKDGIPVVKLDEYEITPKPKPGFFKGCL